MFRDHPRPADLPPPDTVWLEGSSAPPAVERGDSVEAEGSLVLPASGGFADYLHANGIAVELKASDFRRRGPSSDSLVRLADAARRGLRASIEELFSPRESGLLMGLALGDTSNLDPEVVRDFRATGLSHLLAVSGENVVMVLAPVLALSLLLRLRPIARFVLGVFDGPVLRDPHRL